MQVDVQEAGKTLSSLVAAAERGEDVIIVRDGKPVAKLVRYQAPKVNPPGAWKGGDSDSQLGGNRETHAEPAAPRDGAGEPAQVARHRP